jgi:prolyl 4-hydroxylase
MTRNKIMYGEPLRSGRLDPLVVTADMITPPPNTKNNTSSRGSSDDNIVHDDEQSKQEEDKNDDDDDDDEDDDDSDDDDDDEESDDDTDDDSATSSILLNDIVAGWKQHVVAVFVAIAATFIMHYFYRSTSTNHTSSDTTEAAEAAAEYTLFRRQHAHLLAYQRTANLSFCGTTILPVIANEPGGLTVLDFNLPKELVPFMAHHYAADVLALQASAAAAAASHDYVMTTVDDENTYPPRIIQQTDFSKDSVLKNHEEFACLQNQVKSSTKTFIKGLAYYYKTPTLQSMYRTVSGSNHNNNNNIDHEEEDDEDQAHGVVSLQSNKKSAGRSSRLQPVHLTFTGFAVKVVNLSHKPVLLHWDGTSAASQRRGRRLIGEIGPFQSLGTAATSAGQAFFVSPVHDASHAMTRWIATADAPILYHEPAERDFNSWRAAYQERQDSDSLDDNNDNMKLVQYYIHYQLHALNRAFAKEYLIASKRQWLAHFPRPLPVHQQWPAAYIGQQHSVDVPVSFNTGSVIKNETSTTTATTNRTLTLQVVSVLPRVFVIDNFLSVQECQQIQRLAAQEGLKPSTMQAGNTGHQQRDRSTRSSSNTWLARSNRQDDNAGDHSSSVTEDVYRRAAHVLNIDESLLQKHWIDDHLNAQSHSLAESLQVVRYQQGEEYTPHHDFVYPPTLHRHQPTRFATLLLYLNDNFTGGETVFPRAVNTQYHDGLAITPQRGRAVLFYNMLPDGNMNDLSQHSSRPILQGEKWLANCTFVVYVVVSLFVHSLLCIPKNTPATKFSLTQFSFLLCLPCFFFQYGFGIPKSTRGRRKQQKERVASFLPFVLLRRYHLVEML